MSTYPPTRCGLATFSESLVRAIEAQQPRGTVGVLEVVDQLSRHRHGDVIGQLAGGDGRSLTAAAMTLEMFDVVLLQHEYGIFPGPDGAAVLDLLDRVTTPVVTVLHTVLSRPTRSQRIVLEQVVAKSAAVVVMTHTARDRLRTTYGVDSNRVEVIPHGAALPLAASPPPAARPTMLSWGLLGPGKGIEHAIDALALLQDLRPQPGYVIAGQTHPKVRGRTGDAYREMLMARARDRGVADQIEFDDRYVSQTVLTALIHQADVVVLPYESREQVTSGVLVDAVACGRPVIATAFPHAVELLPRGAGLVVPHDDPAALAGALRRFFTEPRLAERLRAGARALAPEMSWDAVASRYLALAAEVTVARTPSVA
ncbi:MAG TPA: glycosyltransferase [Euzebyales bacterium]|nr:glycosyltransferase [Euzebyales bacterium]